MNIRTRLLYRISGILLTGCNSNNNADLDNKKALSTGNVSDTTLLKSDVVVKGGFTLKTWCNGNLQAWQKAIVTIETQGIQPENSAHIYSTYTGHILFIMFALVELAFILIMASYLTINTNLVLNLLMIV